MSGGSLELIGRRGEGWRRIATADMTLDEAITLLHDDQDTWRPSTEADVALMLPAHPLIDEVRSRTGAGSAS